MILRQIYQKNLKKYPQNQIEIKEIIKEVFDLNELQFWTRNTQSIKSDSSKYRKLLRMIQKVKIGVPLDYILGYKYFNGEKFLINKNVLIPREDTEILLNKVIDILKTNISFKVLEIGTGSGILPISILKSVKLTNPIEACDISKKALYLAKKNRKKHKISKEKLIFKQCDLFPKKNKDVYDLIFSNPPYISEDDYWSLDNKIINYEPRQALCGGKRGDEIIKRIIKESFHKLRIGGHLLIEIAYNQQYLINELKKIGFTHTKCHLDNNSIPRVISGIKK